MIASKTDVCKKCLHNALGLCLSVKIHTDWIRAFLIRQNTIVDVSLAEECYPPSDSWLRFLAHARLNG